MNWRAALLYAIAGAAGGTISAATIFLRKTVEGSQKERVIRAAREVVSRCWAAVPASKAPYISALNVALLDLDRLRKK